MKLGKLGHVGIVTRDIEASARYYGALMGIKQWYEMNYETDPVGVRNGKTIDGKMRLFVGGKGSSVIELVQPLKNEGIYVDFLDRRGEGIHHVMYGTKHLDKDIAECEAAGMKVLFRAQFSSAGSKMDYAYVGKGEDDVVLELVETTLPWGAKKGAVPFEMQMGVLTGNYKKVNLND